jgi:phage/plasmid-like protein (TIGR03299 family)
MAYIGECPWHGLGTRVPPSVSSLEMLQAARLHWQVHKTPATGAREILHHRRPPTYDQYFITRDCVGNETSPPVLGMVKSGYEPLQNQEAFAFFDPFLAASAARYESAGALGNGERVWVQVRVSDPIKVADGDDVNPFILLTNSHNGRGALTVRFTPIRVVCQNTLNLATEGGDQVISIRHSRHVRQRLMDTQLDFLEPLVKATFARATEQFAILARTGLTSARMDAFVRSLFPQSERQKEKDERPVWWDAIEEVMENAAITPGKTKNTMWGLYNAVTRVEDYRIAPKATPDSRLDRVWFGRGADLKVKALSRALELCV